MLALRSYLSRSGLGKVIPVGKKQLCGPASRALNMCFSSISKENNSFKYSLL